MEISYQLCSGLPPVPSAFLLSSTRASNSQLTPAIAEPPSIATSAPRSSRFKACSSSKYAAAHQFPNPTSVFLKNKMKTRVEAVPSGMLSPRKSFYRRRRMTEFNDGADEAKQKKWWKMMTEIEETGSALTVLKRQITEKQSVPKDLVLGTLVRFKQLKKWNHVIEILEWVRDETWWNFNETDFLMLITAYGKQGDFNKAERVLSFMNKEGYVPSVVSYTGLMEAYGKGGQYNNAEAIFRRMQSSGPEPSALTYQIILTIFVQGNKFKEAEEVFETLLDDEKSPLKPDQKMFHMMIYMFKKCGDYEKARKIFALMAARGVPRSTVTYNSLMSFENSYKEVSNIYNQMTRDGLRPDVVSYASLINAYGKARREGEALAVFEEMLDAGVRPTRKAYNILLDAFAISGMVEQAKTVFKSMRRHRCAPDLCSYSTMLSAYVNASDMEGAEKFFRRLKRDGFQPNVVTYGTLTKGYARANNLEKMMQTYEEMRLLGIKANQTIFTTIMDSYGKSRDFSSAVIWYKEMESNGVPPDQKAKNILLSLAKTTEEEKEAKQVVGILENSVNGISRIVSNEDYDEDDDANEYEEDEDDDANEYEEDEDDDSNEYEEEDVSYEEE